jgi:ribosomal protein S12 methylthiotransferase accessory factor
MHYPFAGGPRFCAADTNGCAAGQSVAEARLGALLELIERDAVAVWWYNRLRRPALELAGVPGIGHEEFDGEFRELGRSLWVLDVTTDLGVPACVAVAAKLDGSEPCFGASAGMSYADAVRKAVAEAAQICFWAGRGEGPEELLAWLRHATLADNPYLVPEDRREARAFGSHSAEGALVDCVARLTAAGIRPLFIDQTRRELGTPVVRAVAPGLRHFWARLGPGRLYDVPVRMGIRAEARSEDEMNPVACMI